jgi:hypothetical protein
MRIHRFLVWGAIGLAALVILGAGSAILMRKSIARRIILAELNRAGYPDADLRVTAFTDRRLVLSDLHLGSPDELRFDALRLRYSFFGALDGKIWRLHIDGGRFAFRNGIDPREQLRQLLPPGAASPPSGIEISLIHIDSFRIDPPEGSRAQPLALDGRIDAAFLTGPTGFVRIEARPVRSPASAAGLEVRLSTESRSSSASATKTKKLEVIAPLPLVEEWGSLLVPDMPRFDAGIAVLELTLRGNGRVSGEITALGVELSDYPQLGRITARAEATARMPDRGRPPSSVRWKLADLRLSGPGLHLRGGNGTLYLFTDAPANEGHDERQEQETGPLPRIDFLIEEARIGNRRLNDITGSASLDGGTLTLDRLSAEHRGATLNATGTVDLARKRADLGLEANDLHPDLGAVTAAFVLRPGTDAIDEETRAALLVELKSLGLPAHKLSLRGKEGSVALGWAEDGTPRAAADLTLEEVTLSEKSTLTDLSLKGGFSDGVISLDAFSAKLGEAFLRANGRLRPLERTANLHVNTTDLAFARVTPLLKRFGIPTDDLPEAGTLSVRGQLAAGDRRLQIKNATVDISGASLRAGELRLDGDLRYAGTLTRRIDGSLWADGRIITTGLTTNYGGISAALEKGNAAVEIRKGQVTLKDGVLHAFGGTATVEGTLTRKDADFDGTVSWEGLQAGKMLPLLRFLGMPPTFSVHGHAGGKGALTRSAGALNFDGSFATPDVRISGYGMTASGSLRYDGILNRPAGEAAYALGKLVFDQMKIDGTGRDVVLSGISGALPVNGIHPYATAPEGTLSIERTHFGEILLRNGTLTAEVRGEELVHISTARWHWGEEGSIETGGTDVRLWPLAFEATYMLDKVALKRIIDLLPGEHLAASRSRLSGTVTVRVNAAARAGTPTLQFVGGHLTATPGTLHVLSAEKARSFLRKQNPSFAEKTIGEAGRTLLDALVDALKDYRFEALEIWFEEDEETGESYQRLEFVAAEKRPGQAFHLATFYIPHLRGLDDLLADRIIPREDEVEARVRDELEDIFQ